MLQCDTKHNLFWNGQSIKFLWCGLFVGIKSNNISIKLTERDQLEFLFSSCALNGVKQSSYAFLLG